MNASYSARGVGVIDARSDWEGVLTVDREILSGEARLLSLSLLLYGGWRGLWEAAEGAKLLDLSCFLIDSVSVGNGTDNLSDRCSRSHLI